MATPKPRRGAQPESGLKRAALYPRVSTGKQEEEGTSLGTQEAACRKYAAEHGYTVAEEHVYREVHTGTELWERPQLARMREAVRRRDVDVVVAFAIDRLSRDPVHMGVIVSEADHAGVGVEFVTEPLDNSPEGQLIRFVRGYAAKVEHEKIKERSIRGKRARAESGKIIPAGRPLYGYQWTADHTAFTPNESTRRNVERMYLEAARGHSLRRIAQGLVQDRIPRPSGADTNGLNATTWGVRTIWLILTNPSYAGDGAAFRYSKTGPPVALPAGTVPALVDRALFAAVQVHLSQNKLSSPRNSRTPEESLLRGGYVRCGYCGWAMHVYRSTSHRKPNGELRATLVYRCSRGYKPGYGKDGECRHVITLSVLDGAVWAHIAQLLTRPDLIAAELERMRDNDPGAGDIEAVERSLTAVVRQQRNLIENLANVNGGAGTVITNKINALEAQRDQLAAERETILARSRSWQETQRRLGDVQAWCHAVAASLGELTYSEKRLALNALGVQAKVWRTDHEPRYEIRASVPLDTLSAAIARTTPASNSRHNPP